MQADWKKDSNKPPEPPEPPEPRDQPPMQGTDDTSTRVRIALLRELANESSEDPTTWFLLGRELAGAGEAAEAAKAFERAIAAQADYTAAYRQLGNALEQSGGFEEAAAVYARGIEVAERTHDLQAGKEMRAFLKRLARDRGVEPR